MPGIKRGPSAESGRKAAPERIGDAAAAITGKVPFPAAFVAGAVVAFMTAPIDAQKPGSR